MAGSREFISSDEESVMLGMRWGGGLKGIRSQKELPRAQIALHSAHRCRAASLPPFLLQGGLLPNRFQTRGRAQNPIKHIPALIAVPVPCQLSQGCLQPLITWAQFVLLDSFGSCAGLRCFHRVLNFTNNLSNTTPN